MLNYPYKFIHIMSLSSRYCQVFESQQHTIKLLNNINRSFANSLNKSMQENVLFFKYNQRTIRKFNIELTFSVRVFIFISFNAQTIFLIFCNKNINNIIKNIIYWYKLIYKIFIRTQIFSIPYRFFLYFLHEIVSYYQMKSDQMICVYHVYRVYHSSWG